MYCMYCERRKRKQEKLGLRCKDPQNPKRRKIPIALFTKELTFDIM